MECKNQEHTELVCHACFRNVIVFETVFLVQANDPDSWNGVSRIWSEAFMTWDLAREAIGARHKWWSDLERPLDRYFEILEVPVQGTERPSVKEMTV